MYLQMRRISIYTLLVLFSCIYQTASADTEANKAISRRDFEEALNQGNVEVYDEIIASDAILHTVSGDIIGLDAIKGFTSMIFTAFPDINFSIEDMVAEGDMVVTRWTNTGTQQGEYMGIPATGISTAGTGMSIHRITDGKIQELWLFADDLGMLQQLGVMPATRDSYDWGEQSQVTGDTGDPESNKTIFQHMFDEVFVKGNIDLIDEVFAADFIMHDPVSPMEIKGPQGYKQLNNMYFIAFPDIEFVNDDIIAEGDIVVGRWTITGTHEGEFMGIPATGRRITTTGVSIFRFADSKIVETWASYDALGMMMQLTTPEWSITGAWINIIPIPDLGNILGVLTVSPQDSSGVNFTSVLRAGKPEATVFGSFPDADHQSDHIGQIIKVGLNTYESSAIGYGTKKSEISGMLPEIIYISVLYAKMQLTDENTMQGQGTHSFYAPFQDADGNGLPDDGQEPVACFPYTITSKRVQLMPACVPPPPEGE